VSGRQRLIWDEAYAAAFMVATISIGMLLWDGWDPATSLFAAGFIAFAVVDVRREWDDPPEREPLSRWRQAGRSIVVGTAIVLTVMGFAHLSLGTGITVIVAGTAAAVGSATGRRWHLARGA
jgi:hypothetical protein